MKRLLVTLTMLFSLSEIARSETVSQSPPKIQMAILLDTSNSMDGLIDQAREQLWNVVDEFSRTQRQGIRPRLEVAVFEYGNAGLPAQDGYTREVLGFTTELDRVSEALFSLTTNGGDEYCGYAIKRAISSLQWSSAENDLRTVFIAGNEPFTQGPVPFRSAIENAIQRQVVVNTIHAGAYQTGVSEGWQNAATLAGGNYMSIDHNQQIVHVDAPQDQKIAELNEKLNQTYVPFGRSGAESSKRQAEQDKKSQTISPGLLAKRAKSKASSLYDNASWDLVDAEQDGEVQLESLEEDALPAEMRPMALAEREAYVAEKARERAAIKSEILKLHGARDAYVKKHKAERKQEEGSTLKAAITSAVKAQGRAKGYEFDDIEASPSSQN